MQLLFCSSALHFAWLVFLYPAQPFFKGRLNRTARTCFFTRAAANALCAVGAFKNFDVKLARRLARTAFGAFMFVHLQPV